MKTRIVELKSAPSTQTYAKEHYFSFLEGLTIIQALKQTGGHGRFGRPWVSKGENLTLTYAFSLLLDQKDLTALGLLLSFSAYTLLKGRGLSPRIKWPNDLLVNGKKIAGVLVETEFHSDFVTIFAGIGLNVNATKNDLSSIDQPATSLLIETARSSDLNQIQSQLTQNFSKHLTLFKEMGFAPFKEEYKQNLAYTENDGCLFLKDEKGPIHSILSGEIEKKIP
ncbi:MAG: biotin--[acetyl-CoA-carboxylase] ligase [Simkaniaceae bacterium]